MGSHIADYISDPGTSYGRVELRERPATPEEVGQPIRAVSTGQGPHLYREGRTIGFCKPEARNMRENDTLMEVVPTANAVA